MSAKKKAVLCDLFDELDGKEIEDMFEVGGIQWTMRLLNDDENRWALTKLPNTSVMGMAVGIRLPTLAVGIREINGIPVEDYVREKLTEDEEGELDATEGDYKFEYVAEKFMKRILGKRSPETTSALYEKWQELEGRRRDAQEELKKSSRGSSKKETSESTNESSPDGDMK